MAPMHTEHVLTWNDAKEKCENQNASLLSINSDSEWRMLSEFFQFNHSLTYIGLKIKVSRKAYDFIKWMSNTKINA